MDDIRYIYLQATNGIEEAIDEKQLLFEEMFYFIFCFSSHFRNSPNLFDLLSSVYNYYIEVMKDINREQDVYEELKEYMREVEDEELERLSQDEEFITDIMNMFSSIEEIVERRLLNHAKNYGFYKDLLDCPNLNNRFYRSIKYKSMITEEKKLKYLSLIPRG